MKKTELRKIIRESIREVLSNSNIDDLFETNMVGNYGLGTQEWLRYRDEKNEDISLRVPQWNNPTKLDQLGRVLKGMIDNGEIRSRSPEGLRPTEDYKYGAYAVDESWSRVGRAIEGVYGVQLDKDWWEKPGDPGPLADMNVVTDVLQLLEDNRIIYLEW